MDSEIMHLAQAIGSIEAKVEDLHRVFYRNGFKQRIDNIENAIREFRLTRSSTCPVAKDLHDTLTERSTTDEAYALLRSERKRWIAGYVVTVGAFMISLAYLLWSIWEGIL